MRRLLERMVRNWTFTRSIEAGGNTGRIVVSPDARLAYLKPGNSGFDPDLLALVEKRVRPGMVVWDIGANVGVFSVASALVGATVVAVEADVWLVEVLRRNAALYNDMITVVPAAVSARCGTASFAVAGRGRASNALVGFGRSQMGGARQTVTVPTLTLDTLLADHPAPDLLKIDVEGAELPVLRGASEVLTRKPELFVELAAEDRAQCCALLGRFGYRPHTLDGKRLSKITGSDVLFLEE